MYVENNDCKEIKCKMPPKSSVTFLENQQDILAKKKKVLQEIFFVNILDSFVYMTYKST